MRERDVIEREIHLPLVPLAVPVVHHLLPRVRGELVPPPHVYRVVGLVQREPRPLDERPDVPHDPGLERHEAGPRDEGRDVVPDVRLLRHPGEDPGHVVGGPQPDRPVVRSLPGASAGPLHHLLPVLPVEEPADLLAPQDRHPDIPVLLCAGYLPGRLPRQEVLALIPPYRLPRAVVVVVAHGYGAVPRYPGGVAYEPLQPLGKVPPHLQLAVIVPLEVEELLGVLEGFDRAAELRPVGVARVLLGRLQDDHRLPRERRDHGRQEVVVQLRPVPVAREHLGHKQQDVAAPVVGRAPARAGRRLLLLQRVPLLLPRKPILYAVIDLAGGDERLELAVLGSPVRPDGVDEGPERRSRVSGRRRRRIGVRPRLVV
mmetsp:Transcript_50770/g.108193  ORF Transcript_50770/g.108193 Transcript_50770/m.108193 type:complete len:372 (-) Transcript_50770:161-1276(-)